MKQSLWQIKGLQRLLEAEMRVELIAEPLHVVDEDAPAGATAGELAARGYDECGVRRGQAVHEIAERDALAKALANAVVGQHTRPAPLGRIVAASTPLWACVDRLAEHGSVFVLGNTGLEGIVAAGDLNKPPARLLMFGLISMIEMAMVDIVRAHHPDEAWRELLAPKRVEAALRIHKDRRERRQEIDLTDCLQWCDKSAICIKTPGVLAAWGLGKNAAEDLFEDLRIIRDQLAHAQSPAVAGGWREVIAKLRQGHATLVRTVEFLGGET
ncbi:MAG: hypothetical protein NTW19_02615 [Planctomycetota bacterium]|nr:hypothetical protein [Planctomycetota bacterium]